MTTVQPAGLKGMKQKWISGDEAEFFDVCPIINAMCVGDGAGLSISSR